MSDSTPTTTIVIRNSVWTRSTREEIICVAWTVAAVLAAGFEFTAWAWVFGIKAASDAVCSIALAITEKGKQ